MPKKPKLQWEPEPFGPKCYDCPYKQWSRGYVPPEIRPLAPLVILGEAAAYWECLEGVPFAGKTGGKLNIWLEHADGRTRLDVSLINAVRCRPIEWELCEDCLGDGHLFVEMDDRDEPVFADCPSCGARGWVPSPQADGDWKTATPEPEQISECMKRYGHKELRELLQKRLIVALGGSALYALTGYQGITQYQGSVLDTDHGPVLVTYHPAAASYAPEYEPAGRKAFTRIPGILAGSEGEGLEIKYITQPSEADLAGYYAVKSAVVDLETSGGTSPEVKGGEIRVAGASKEPGHAIVLQPGAQLRTLLEGLDEVIGQYFYAYDAWWLHHKGYPVPPTIVDTQVLGHTVNPLTPNDITFLQSQYAEPPLKEFWKSESAYADDLAGVALHDVDATGRIERGLFSELKRQGQWDLARDVIIPWCRLAFELRRDGIRCDVGMLREQAVVLDEEVRRDGLALSDATGIPLPKKSKTGIPSPKAVADFLYGTLKLPLQKNRKTGKITADERALKKLRSWCWKNGHHDGLYFLTKMIGKPNEAHEGEWDIGLKHRSTMVKDLKKFAGEDDGERIRTQHAFVNLTGTVTGRLSYERPGLHQVPKHCRKAFLPDRDDHILLQFDYKQIEFLTMLWFAREWEKLAVGLAGKDFHKFAAALFYGISEDDVTPKQRSNVKALNFGMIFGKGAFTTAEDLDITLPEAENLYARWFETFKGVPSLRSRWISSVETLGYIQTPAGWRMPFTREDRENTQRRSVETQIYNYPIQSTAGIRTRHALVDLWRELGRLWSPEDVRFMLTVHDSGILSVRRDLASKVYDVVQEVVTSPYAPLPADIPGHEDGIRFPIDVEVGHNWGDMRKVKDGNANSIASSLHR